MKKLSIYLSEEVVSLLETFARDCRLDVKTADLVAVIVQESRQVRDLQAANGRKRTSS
jgi:hypothetical protein